MSDEQRKVVLIMSGGLDSTVLFYWFLRRNYLVRPVGFNYGQRHGRELTAAQRICTARGLHYEVIDLSAIRPFIGGSSQTSDNVAVPHGHYAEESMKQTVVPNRNMIMLSVAAGFAISLGYDAIAYGAHTGDHAIYPDCRYEFACAMRDALLICDWSPIKLMTPFIGIDKSRIVKLGEDMGVPFDQTWSCYEGGAFHCGRCGTCVERKLAFSDAGVIDPTYYRNVKEEVAS